MPSKEYLASQFKPGHSGNPLGNALDRHSTKKFSKVINDLLDNEEIEIKDLKNVAKTAKAREAVTIALIKKALGTELYGAETPALKLLMEWADGPLEKQIDITSKGEKISGTDERYAEMMDKIRQPKSE